MFSRTADLYDLIYSTFKDYGAEARRLSEIIRGKSPRAKTVLDVACGTGEHARLLREAHGFAVDGLDLEPAFVEISRRKNPDGTFHRADMRDFALRKRYDAVLCLFSSIGYVKTLENVEKTLANFRQHLNPDGVLIVEPWFTPEVFQDGRVDFNTAETDELKVCRMSRCYVRDRLSVVEFGYVIGSAEGIRFERETHEAGLFTHEELRAAFERAGFEVEFDAEGFMGRGLFVASPLK